MLPNHQPDCRFGEDGLMRGLHQARSSVANWSRQIRAEIKFLRTAQDPHRIARGKAWIEEAWAWRRSKQQAVVAYRGLIAERDMNRLFAAE